MNRLISSFKYNKEGASAVEFAIVGPLFLCIVFGVVVYGTYFTIKHGLEQLAAEAARASIGGLSDTERSQLALSYVQSNVGSYTFLNPAQLTVTAGWTDATDTVYQVSASYNLSSSYIFSLGHFVPMPSSTTTASAAIQRGGY